MKQSGPRHAAREFALRELFAVNLLKNADIEPITPIANWWGKDDRLRILPEADEFARRAIEGVANHLEQIDALIAQHAANWRLERMPNVDRNILRLGAWEILNTDTPVKVILNEALELAKCYGESESPRFVNGILDPLAKSFRESGQ